MASTVYLVGVMPLEAAVVSSQLENRTKLALDPDEMVLTVSTPQGQTVFTPSLDARKRVVWQCESGEGLKPSQLPQSCRDSSSK